MRNRVFGYMRTAKAEIGLRIRAVWSGPSLSAKKIIGHLTIECINEEQTPGWDYASVGWIWICAFRACSKTFSLGSAQVNFTYCIYPYYSDKTGLENQCRPWYARVGHDLKKTLVFQSLLRRKCMPRHRSNVHVSFGSLLLLAFVIRYQEFASERSPGPEVIKLFSCSTQLSMKFSLLINMKMHFHICREIFMLSYV